MRRYRHSECGRMARIAWTAERRKKRYNLKIYDLTHYLGSTFFLGQKPHRKCRLRRANVGEKKETKPNILYKMLSFRKGKGQISEYGRAVVYYINYDNCYLGRYSYQITILIERTGGHNEAIAICLLLVYLGWFIVWRADDNTSQIWCGFFFSFVTFIE